MEIIVASDPVILSRSWLVPRLPGVTVVKNRPNPVQGKVVVVRRSGGSPGDMVTDPAWLTIECFAPTDLECSQLAHLTWALIRAMAGEVIDGVQCYRVQTLGGPADMPLTDPGEKQRHRYVMSAQVTFRTRA